MDLKDFEFERVLRNSPEEKVIWLLGTMKGDAANKAILELSKAEFQD